MNLSGRAGAYEEYLPREWSKNLRKHTYPGEQLWLFLLGKKSWIPCFEEVQPWVWKLFRSSGVDLVDERHRRIWMDEDVLLGRRWVPLQPPWKPPREQLSIRSIGASSVYFAQDPVSAEVKIGFSRNVRSRLRALGRSVRLLATIDGNREVESAIHHRFRHARVHGEWFRPIPELLSYIDEVKIG